MTQDKARKTAARQRMAATGEPYSVARHAVESTHDVPEAPAVPHDDGSYASPAGDARLNAAENARPAGLA